jgi:flagellar biosynthesis/type III secretory pathway chaperone
MMPSTALTAETLSTLDGAITELEQAMQAEVEGLRQGNVEHLLDAVSRKSRSIRQIDNLVGQAGLRESLQSLILDPTLDQGPLGPLALRLRQCREQNIATGGALATARRMNDMALQMLGQQTTPDVYERQGLAAAGQLGHRSLGQA